jgi:hypothetical protein
LYVEGAVRSVCMLREPLESEKKEEKRKRDGVGFGAFVC